MKTLFAALSLVAAPVTVSASTPASPMVGTWRNAGDSVRIKVAPCGAGLCGTVISANEKARADAARGGTTNLVGTQLFRDFRRGADGVYAGQVFVPDLNVAVTGTLRGAGRDRLIAAGCLFGSFGCQEQTWTRV